LPYSVVVNQQMYWQIRQKMIYVSKYIIFMVSFGSQGLLNNDLTVWPDEARPVYTCIPPSFAENASAQPFSIHPPPPQKYVCKYIEIKIG
jgi:hypothetical protein